MRPEGEWNCVGALVDDFLCVIPVNITVINAFLMTATKDVFIINKSAYYFLVLLVTCSIKCPSQFQDNIQGIDPVCLLVTFLNVLFCLTNSDIKMEKN